MKNTYSTATYLGFCGDTHGREFDTRKLNGKNFPKQNSLSSEDTIIQLGDFGWYFYRIGENVEQDRVLNRLTEKKWSLAVIDGNHENFDLLESLPVIEKWGAPVYELKLDKGSVFFLQRGYVYTISGKTIFAFGGARSSETPENSPKTWVPKELGLHNGYFDGVEENIDWWQRELPSEEEYQRGRDSLEKVEWKVDYVATHTCPSSCLPIMKDLLEGYQLDKWEEDEYDERGTDPVSEYFQEIFEKLDFESWEFGHFHIDFEFKNLGKNFRVRYEAPPTNKLIKA